MGIFPVGSVLADDMELLKNPTLAYLAGEWVGNARGDRGGYQSQKSVQMTFIGGGATYASETGYFKARVQISGEEINIVTRLRTDACKLHKASNSMILLCSYRIASSPNSRGGSGSMRLEKKMERC
jgi:hypothetical protein